MISIIIPTLSEEKYLEKTLQILKNGIGTIDHEIIISDGGSTDTTLAIAKKYTNKIVIYNEVKRQTIAQARNLGASRAIGDYLVFMDADVMILESEHFFTRALTIFNQRTKLVGLCVSIGVEPEKATRVDKFFSGFMDCFSYSMNNILHQGSASGEFQMIRTEAFRNLGGFREDLVATEDMELFWRLSRIGQTRMEWSLRIFHSGRRAHAIGWPHLLWLWFLNTMSTVFLHRSHSRVWTVIR